jgi:antitoxin MazE
VDRHIGKLPTGRRHDPNSGDFTTLYERHRENHLTSNEYCNYDVIMKTQIIRIGNSQGIRIPKVLLEEAGMGGDVELEICSGGILIRNINKPRSNWDTVFSSFAEAEDDIPIGPEVSSRFEKKEWQW